jgi:hypothetical protein
MTLLVGLAVAALVGCATSDELIATPPLPGIPPDTELVVIAPSDTVTGSLHADGPGEVPENACECDGQVCFEAWAEQYLGCNVCVVFLCDGVAYHACHFCPEPGPGGSDGGAADPPAWQRALAAEEVANVD